MNARVKPHLSSVGARWCAMVLLSSGVLMGCSKKQDDKPAGLPPLTGAAAPALPASPALPAAALPAPAPAAPAPEEALAPTGPPIEGLLELPAARKKDVAPADLVFLSARAVSDTPGVRGSLVAVKRFPATKFPIPFSLGPQDMMIPGGAFSGELTITARIDKDGDPMTHKKGDVVGVADHVKVGAKGVKVVLGELQKEDESLLGSTTMPPHGGPPNPGVPGLPPGHP
jgi:hypothetical protein